MKRTPKIKFGKFFLLARQNATDGIDDLVQDILRQEEVHCYEADVYEDKCRKQDFLAYTATVPQEVLFLWNQYPRFFDTDYIAELVFFEEYMKLRKNVLADYHRFRVLYGDAENGTYLPMIEQTMAILTQLPFCKK